MKTNTEQPWIEAGYEIFSKEGPAGLKVDQLARAVGISRSSFYHLFADLAIFEEKLLAHHAQRVLLAAEKAKKCKAVDPDFILAIVEEKDYVLFNRQLRIHRDNPVYKAAFENAVTTISKETGGIWIAMLGMQQKPDVAMKVYMMAADILFHRMTPENMNYEWLKAFTKEISQFVKQVNTNNLPQNNL